MAIIETGFTPLGYRSKLSPVRSPALQGHQRCLDELLGEKGGVDVGLDFGLLATDHDVRW